MHVIYKTCDCAGAEGSSKNMSVFNSKEPHFLAFWRYISILSTNGSVIDRKLEKQTNEEREALSTVICTCFVRGFLGGATQMNERAVVEFNKTNPRVVLKEWLLCVPRADRNSCLSYY